MSDVVSFNSSFPRRDHHPNGNLWMEKYALAGSLHRLDGPAVREWSEAGFLTYEAFYIEGERYREDGPAQIWWREDGSVERVVYWLDLETVGFWDFFKKSSHESQRTLLRDWLHLVE
jgi:hypothetical protein